MTARTTEELPIFPPNGLPETEGSQPPPDALPVLPLGDTVLFPGMIIPLVINTPRSILLVDEITDHGNHFLGVLQKAHVESDDLAEPKDLYKYGCMAQLLKTIRFPDDTLRVLIQGVSRCRITEFTDVDPYIQARYKPIADTEDQSIETLALARNASKLFQEVVDASPQLPEELKIAVINVDNPGELSDLIASNLNLSLAERQKLLANRKVKARLERLTTPLNKELKVLALGSKIQNEVGETFAKSQRDSFLREQMRAIQRELGDESSQQADVEELRERLRAADLPEKVQLVADKELNRLANIPTASPEYALARTYLDCIAELPWNKSTEDQLDIVRAKRTLDRDHYDLSRVKDRILEYLSVLKLKKDLKGPILCLVGPPGVGKTSLGRSVARALGREFIRMSLGGVHDEAEIRGHRRTYIGALPGRIIQGLRNAGTNNPVFMLDEIDKLGNDFRGDPASALLEVLDPEQNFSFEDHYLDVPFDLSQVLFMTTANMLDTIPHALRDRMEVLELSGYTLKEKSQIARRFLAPKQIEAHGLTKDMITIRVAAIDLIISGYTREAGVRNLERQLANVCRKVARKVAEGRTEKTVVDKAMIRELLGPVTHEPEVAEKKAAPGVVTGLAWTPVGGEILFIEATRMPGKGLLQLTGLLGDVMKESAQAARSYVRSHGEKLGIDPKIFENEDIHIHVPAGATPKDGPSAGVAITMALISLLTGRAIDPKTAMTGEINLRGRVMPVGGVKDKVLAASRAGIKTVILPARNKNSLEELPEEIAKKLTFIFVDTAEEALQAAACMKKRKK